MLRKIYYRILRDFTASKINAAMYANPETIEEIKNSDKYEKGRGNYLRYKCATESILMADELVKSIKAKNKLDRGRRE